MEIPMFWFCLHFRHWTEVSPISWWCIKSLVEKLSIQKLWYNSNLNALLFNNNLPYESSIPFYRAREEEAASRSPSPLQLFGFLHIRDFSVGILTSSRFEWLNVDGFASVYIVAYFLCTDDNLMTILRLIQCPSVVQHNLCSFLRE